MSDNKNHMLKKDADLVRGGKTEKDIHLHNELHPADRKNGKGVKESKQFHVYSFVKYFRYFHID